VPQRYNVCYLGRSLKASNARYIMFAISADSESLKREICIHKHVQQSVPQRLRAGSIAGVSRAFRRIVFVLACIKRSELSRLCNDRCIPSCKHMPRCYLSIIVYVQYVAVAPELRTKPCFSRGLCTRNSAWRRRCDQACVE
jgi:hypothetical protein